MSIYERYKRQIQERIAEGHLTKEYIKETTKRLDVYLSKGKITQEEYDELIELMNPNK
jgi:hypothetical protein